ncbi:MAG TPA: alpha-amylase family glycosyl hydrolase, partial [Rudaea sp.]|nr:alpha-amylase family glycosyl hydrolase [Rudaea sp.]
MNAFGVRYWLALCLCAWSIGAHPSPVFQSIQQLGGFLNSDGNNVTFRVYSAAATRIEVDLYKQASGVAPAARYTLTKQSGTSLWSVQVSASSLRSLGFDIDPTNASKLFTNVYYGYRAWGSNWTYSSAWNANGNPGAGFVADVDTTGARFNPNKLLLDPYALEMSHDYTSAASQDPTIFASGVSASGGTADRLRNSELVAPKGIVAMPFGAGWAALNFGSKPAGVQKDDVIYEVDLRGLSRNDSAAGSCAGTYQGAIAEIPYLQSLGITALELQPVHETENDANDMNIAALGRASNTTAGDNYWGYMTTDYFAPDRHYACDKSLGGPTREFVAMVKAYHDAGIKVVLDVVYNH